MFTIKKRLQRNVALMIVGFLSFGGLSFAEENPDAIRNLSHAFHQAIAKVKPAVVSISAEKEARKLTEEEIPEILKPFLPKDFFDDPTIPKRGWQGSGVIISSEGEILTNYHVVKDADELTVTLDDGTELEASEVAHDEGSDIALIKLKEDKPLPFAVLGNSDELQVGDWVLAIGNPFGLSQSVSQGIVSAKGRTNADVPVGFEDGFRFKDFIQTTAAINLGNSGGPLINLNGEVIGVNNAIQTAGRIPANLGIGFAIPSNLAKSVIDSLKHFGKVRRGFIGVGLNNEPSSMKYFKEEYGINYGALVKEVNPDTPGEKAGLKTGDLIIRFEGKKVEGNEHLITMVAGTAVGSEVELTILREGKEQTIKLILDERPPEQQLARAVPSMGILGIAVETLSPEIAKEKGYEEDLKGVIVTRVLPDTPAAAWKIQVNDVITKINEQSVESKDDFEKIFSEFVDKMREKGRKKRTLLLYLHRAGSRMHPDYVGPEITIE
ncbi:MAG: Do family serine endopeptidase [Candidatus Omnitrophota bacterium]|jgi:serine protease Do|nr:MAG: Do family serine endopeptidase [Candidatus Omnitrophota bacterium]